jgi:YVTN family beta-propeller protein
VECDFTAVSCPTAGNFNITATKGNWSSTSFNGSETGTTLTINPSSPVTYQVTETSPIQGFVVGTPIPVGDAPFGIAFNPDNGNLYMTNLVSDTVTVINGSTNTVVGTPIPVGSSPFGIAFNPDNVLLYVTSPVSSTVSVIAPLTTTFSDGCKGNMDNSGQTTLCTITNAYGRTT